MPVSKKKPTTLTSEGSTQESSSPVLPEQKDFRQYLRCLAVSAIQVLIEQVMREEWFGISFPMIGQNQWNVLFSACTPISNHPLWKGLSLHNYRDGVLLLQNICLKKLWMKKNLSISKSFEVC